MAKKTTPKLPKPKTPNRIDHEAEQALKRRITLDDIDHNITERIETRNEGEDGPAVQIIRNTPRKKRTKK
jgi:hypothetical protein